MALNPEIELTMISEPRDAARWAWKRRAQLIRLSRFTLITRSQPACSNSPRR